MVVSGVGPGRKLGGGSASGEQWGTQVCNTGVEQASIMFGCEKV